MKKIDVNGTTVFVYNAGGQLIAEYTGTPSNGGTSYLTSDHLGNTRVVTKADGTVKARYDYLPFGEEIPSTVGTRGSVGGYGSADGTRQKFTQKERDSESGLDYFLARYYSSPQGRFTSPDWSELPEPIPYADLTNPQSLNLYPYALNNPLSSADPDGHQDLLQKLKNGLLGRGFKTDAEIQAARNAAETKKSQEAARAADELKKAGFDPDQISQLSNQQVIDFYNALQRGETSVDSGGVHLVLTIVIPPAAEVVIGKLKDLTAPGAVKPGERTLLSKLPNKGNARSNWEQNARVLREEMAKGRPIRDASVDSRTGALRDNTGFIKAERNLLRQKGWTYDPKTTLWTRP